MSIIAAGTSSGTALVSTGDTNGTLVIQTNGTTVAATFGTDQSLTLVGALSAPSIAGNAVATQAQQETGTSTTVLVTPGRQQFHQSAAKVFGFVTTSGGVPTVQRSYGLSSLTDNGVGDFTVNFSTAFSDANYTFLQGSSQKSAFGIFTIVIENLDSTVRTTTANRLFTVDANTATFDVPKFSFAYFGDQ